MDVETQVTELRAQLARAETLYVNLVTRGYRERLDFLLTRSRGRDNSVMVERARANLAACIDDAKRIFWHEVSMEKST